MRIPLGFNKGLYIEIRYESDKVIIPIGFDNQPHHIINSLHLQKHHNSIVILNDKSLVGLDCLSGNIDNIMKDECYFLYVLKSDDLKSQEDIQTFLKSLAVLFHELKEGQELCIFIRCNEDVDENRYYTDQIVRMLEDSNHVHVLEYAVGLEKNGEWGHRSSYPKLLRDLGVKLKWKLPRIYIK